MYYIMTLYALMEKLEEILWTEKVEKKNNERNLASYRNFQDDLSILFNYFVYHNIFF